MYLPRRRDNSAGDHEGACDVIAVRHEDGSLNTTPFIARFTNNLKNKPVNIIVNGVSTKTAMLVNERSEGYFELTEQELPDFSQRGGLQRFLDPQAQSRVV